MRVEQSMSATIRVDADTRPAMDAVDRLQDRIRRIRESVKVDADTLRASAQVARVTRDRVTNIRLRVDSGSVAKVGAAIAALSGGRAVGGIFADIGRGLSNLDKNLPKIALLATSIVSLTAAALSSGAGLVSLGAGIASIAAAAVLLPGLFAGAAVGLVTLFVALRGAGTQLEPLKQSFLDLRDTIGAEFWARARDPIIDFVNGVLPQLQTGFASVASSLGGYASSLAASFASAFSGDRLQGMFASLAQSIDIASTGTGAIAGAIATLGTVGASYLPNLASWFVDISTRFDAFLSQAAADGSLQTWVDTALTALQQLGSGIASIVSIFGGIESAAAAAGGGGLATFASVLQLVADTINGPAFQSGLTTVLQGANAGFAALGAALGPIGDAFDALAPTISSVLTTAGEALGGFISNIADAFGNSEVFQTGLSSFFDGIKAGLDAIGPAMPAVADALGTLGEVAGTLASTIGSLLGTALTELAPVFQNVLETIEPLIPVLGDALIGALEAIIPAFGQVAQDILPTLADAITAVAPLIPELAQFIADLATTIAPHAGQLLETLLPAFEQLVPAIISMLDALTPLLPLLPMIGAQVQILAGVISTVLTVALAITQIAFTTFTALLTGDWSNFAQKITSITGGLGDSLAGIWNGITSYITNAFSGLINTLSGVMQSIIGTISGFVSQAFSAGKSIVDGIANGIRSAINAVKDAIGGVMQAIANFLPHSPAKVGPLSGKGYSLYSGIAIGRGLEEGMDASVRGVSAAAGRMTAAARVGVGSSGLAGQAGDASTFLATTVQAAMPGQVTLVDADGSILARTRVVAATAVRSGNVQRRVGLENGRNGKV
ncbi:hypothetical protein [Cnuibacter physcomitrellae]|uniref:hypothetical protein n=1 Tax=Cnuibacter physcomitrellae TaxID=1619308 RepID=UPI001664F6A7|nr:hypothetical protein [Cnuibacter physcomitrellae]